MNYKVILAYDGTRYNGWQRQGNTDRTIQGKLEQILTRMSGEKVEVFGSGRTDAGVHAEGQTANFHLKQKDPYEDRSRQIREYVNAYLPEDIAVLSCETVPERFHSRLNAKSKTYRYRVLNSAVPHIFERRYVYQVPEHLDMEAMRRAALLLTGSHDFKAFTSAKKGKKSTVRTVDSIQIDRVGEEIHFTFSGNGFLYHMVRILMGTLLEVGTGAKKPEDMTAILESGSRECAGPLVPACGLALMEVRYS